MPITSDPHDPGLSQIDPATGMQYAYLVLSPEERSQGFARHVRLAYKHVGRPRINPDNATRPATPDERGRGYTMFEEYPLSGSPITGRFWTKLELDGPTCHGAVTTMSRSIAETYARDPSFYGATMCAACRTHLPVGARGEFIWLDTDERVGT